MPARRSQQSEEPHFQLRPAIVEIKTLTIDGKRMTASFFNQIQHAPLIDEESGTLAGMPLGLVNLHCKECPVAEHWHALWVTERGELRQAVATAPSDSEAYGAHQQENEEYCDRLTDALALLLARQERIVSDLLLNPFSFKTRREVRFADGTSLSVSSGSSNAPYEQLASLEKARTTLAQAMEAQPDQAPDQATQALPQAILTTPSLKAAQRVQQALARQHIVLAHPALYQQTPTEAPLHLAEFRAGREHIHHTRFVQENWLVFDIAYHQQRASDWLLFWRSSEHSTDAVTDEEAASVEDQLRPHIQALRVLLADQVVRAHLKKLEQTAKELLPSSLQAGRFLPLPQTVQAALREEQQRFRTYTSRWQHSLQQIRASEQIYILSGFLKSPVRGEKEESIQ